MTTARLSAVIFDLDGTLYRRVDCLPVFLAAQYARRRDLLGALSRDEFIAKFVINRQGISVAGRPYMHFGIKGRFNIRISR